MDYPPFILEKCTLEYVEKNSYQWYNYIEKRQRCDSKNRPCCRKVYKGAKYIMEKYLLPFFTATVISLIMTPFAKKIAYRVGAIDVPKDNRRVHKKPIPLLGGLAIYIATMVSILIFLPIDKTMISIVIGGSIIAISGIIDDIKDLSPKMKLFFQILPKNHHLKGCCQKQLDWIMLHAEGKGGGVHGREICDTFQICFF